MVDFIFKNNNFIKRFFFQNLIIFIVIYFFFLILERIGMNGKFCLFILYIYDLYCRDINYLYV